MGVNVFGDVINVINECNIEKQESLPGLISWGGENKLVLVSNCVLEIDQVGAAAIGYSSFSKPLI